MNNNDKENAQFLKESVKENITLPESLSKENITRLVLPEKQKISKKGQLRRFVAIGFAACLMVTVTAVLYNSGFDFGVFRANEEAAQADKNKPAENHIAAAPASYDELLAYIKEYGAEYVNSRDKYYYATDDMLVMGDAEEGEVVFSQNSVAVPAAPSTSTGSAADAGAPLRGELNLREKDVLENDIFINDGAYIYCINEEGNIALIKAEDDGTLTQKSVITAKKPEYGYYEISGLYKYKDYLIECYNKHEYNKDYTEADICCGVNVYDVSDAGNPVLVKNLAMDAYYSSSRIVDGKLILIGTYGITGHYESDDDSLLLPACYNEGERQVIPAENIICDKEEAPESYVLIMTASLDEPDKAPETVSVLGHSTETYCTKETLYILGTSYTWRSMGSSDAVFMPSFVGSGNADTVITAIDISGDKAEYKNKTEIDGTILNSYSIDEYNGYLRMAVNKSDENLIIVLDKDFNKVGEISGIAKGELIKSARFMGDTAYVVTFVQTDPLFVIDLSDPGKPEIKGEVKLPGFSSYLHPVGDGLLAGIGVGGTENGIDGSAKISLFDVRDPYTPKEIDSIVIENASFETNPKAYTSVSESSFLIPYTIWGTYTNGYSDGRFSTGAMLIEVNNNELVKKNDYCARSPHGTSRATFIDDTVYIYEIYSGVASFDMETGEYIASTSSYDK